MADGTEVFRRLIDQRRKGLKLRNRYLRREDVYLRGPNCDTTGDGCQCHIRSHRQMVEKARIEFLSVDYGKMSDAECRRFILDRREWLEVCAGWEDAGDFIETFAVVPGVPEVAKSILWSIAVAYGNARRSGLYDEVIAKPRR